MARQTYHLANMALPLPLFSNAHLVSTQMAIELLALSNQVCRKGVPHRLGRTSVDIYPMSAAGNIYI